MFFLKRVAQAVLRLVAAATLVGTSSAVIADGGVGSPGEWVQLQTNQGCLVYWHYYFPGYGSLEEYRQNWEVSYRGTGCQPGIVLNGEGELTVRNKGFGDSDLTINRFRGRIVDGVMQGPGTMAYGNDAGNSVNFVAGCESGLMEEGGCTPFRGTRFMLQSGPLAMRGTPSPGDGSDPAALPTPSTPSGSSSPENVWGSCISTEGPEQSGIQMIYYLRNRCTKTVTVSFCMKATYEAAGDWNLCSQRSYKTYDIKPGTRFEFPFTPVRPGDAMSDGRVVDHQEVSASGAACIGSSPSVYVENKTLVFQHC